MSEIYELQCDTLVVKEGHPYSAPTTWSRGLLVVPWEAHVAALAQAEAKLKSVLNTPADCMVLLMTEYEAIEQRAEQAEAKCAALETALTAEKHLSDCVEQMATLMSDHIANMPRQELENLLFKNNHELLLVRQERDAQEQRAERLRAALEEIVAWLPQEPNNLLCRIAEAALRGAP